MRKQRFVRITALLILFFLQQLTARAVTATFAEPDFDWLAQGGSATPYHLWTAGDYWRQNFTSTGLGSTTALTLNLFIENDSSVSSQTLNFKVLLNSTNVGTFALHPSDAGATHQYNYSFPAITGDGYNIEMIATSTISSGAGSYSLAVDGRSFATLVPEPASASMAIVGIVCVSAFSRRRQRLVSYICCGLRR